MLDRKLLEMESAVHRLVAPIADPAVQPPVHPKAPPPPLMASPMTVPPLMPPDGYTGLFTPTGPEGLVRSYQNGTPQVTVFF